MTRESRGRGIVTDRGRRVLFAFETVLGGGALALAMITVIRPDWLEIVFGVDPDRHSGSFEWLIVGICVAIAAIFGIAARAQWRRLHPQEA